MFMCRLMKSQSIMSLAELLTPSEGFERGEVVVKNYQFV